MALNNVPQAGQTLNSTRPLIYENFITFIDTQFAIDHQPFNSVSNSGKHKGIHVIDGVPNPTVASDEIGIYNTVTGGVPALLIKKGTATASDVTTLVGNAAQGSVTLPSGLIYKWGRGSTDIAGLSSVTFTAAFNTIFQATASVSVISGSSSSSVDNIARVYTYSNSAFSLVTYFANTPRTRVSSEYVWFAIGI